MKSKDQSLRRITNLCELAKKYRIQEIISGDITLKFQPDFINPIQGFENLTPDKVSEEAVELHKIADYLGKQQKHQRLEKEDIDQLEMWSSSI
jgi:hypothetical protein